MKQIYIVCCVTMLVNFFDCQAEYAKDKDLKKADVKALMDWVDKQPHLPKINECQAILFLQSCYFRNEAAKAAIDNYFTVRSICPEVFRNRNPDHIKDDLNVCLFTLLPKPTREGYSIIFMKMMDTNPDNYSLAAQLKSFDMTWMRTLHQEGTAKGHLIVVDLQGMSFGHLRKVNPITVKKFLFYLQEAMPVRLKGLHYFNIVPVMDKILALMKPFMKKELMNMLYLHSTIEDMEKYVPRECLPQNYGGSCESLTVLHEKEKANMLNNGAFFEWEQKQTVDESKRVGKQKNGGNYFGIEGTFRKLELD